MKSQPVKRMKLFLDTADVKEIRELAATGLVDGVTTNPSLAAKTGRPFFEALKEICDLVPGSISAEVTALEASAMIDEGKKLARVAPNVTVKVPLTWEGLKACRALTSDGHTVNVTLCFSPNQALLAAKAGATYVSPFIGRLDDAGHDGMALIREIRHIYDQLRVFHRDFGGLHPSRDACARRCAQPRRRRHDAPSYFSCAHPTSLDR